MQGTLVLNAKNSRSGQRLEALSKMRKLLVVWFGVAALFLWAVACGGQPATPTPTETAGYVSTPAVTTPEPEATTGTSPEEPEATATPIPEAPETEPGPSPTTAPDTAPNAEPTTAAVATEPAVPTEAPENTAPPPPTEAPADKAATSTSAPPPTSTPTPAPPPTSTPTIEPTPDIPVGSNVGNRAPEFTLTLTEGRTLTSEELREQGQPFLLFFHSVH